MKNDIERVNRNGANTDEVNSLRIPDIVNEMVEKVKNIRRGNVIFIYDDFEFKDYLKKIKLILSSYRAKCNKLTDFEISIMRDMDFSYRLITKFKYDGNVLTFHLNIQFWSGYDYSFKFNFNNLIEFT